MAHLDRLELLEIREAVAGLLARIDQALARDDAAAPAPVAEGNGPDADDLADSNCLDTTSAAARFGYDRHTLARWARTEGLGVRRGGRWLVSIPRLQRRLNGG